VNVVGEFNPIQMKFHAIVAAHPTLSVHANAAHLLAIVWTVQTIQAVILVVKEHYSLQ
jgi:hypothetical protein